MPGSISPASRPRSLACPALGRARSTFRLTLAAKDASLVKESARQRGLDPPLLDLIARRLREGAAEHGDEDFSATYLTSAPRRAA